MIFFCSQRLIFKIKSALSRSPLLCFINRNTLQYFEWLDRSIQLLDLNYSPTFFKLNSNCLNNTYLLTNNILTGFQIVGTCCQILGQSFQRAIVSNKKFISFFQCRCSCYQGVGSTSFIKICQSYETERTKNTICNQTLEIKIPSF